MNEQEYYTESDEDFNPFLNSLLNPRETIRYVYNNRITDFKIPLLYFFGLDYVLSAGSRNSYNLDLIIVIIMLVMAPISGSILLYLNGFLYSLFGSIFGGEADSEDMRSAILWSKVPKLFLLPVSIFLYVIGANNMSFLMSNFIMAILSILLFIFLTVITIWCFVNLVRMVSEIQEFSSGKAFLSIIIPGLILVLIAILFVFIFASLLRF